MRGVEQKSWAADAHDAGCLGSVEQKSWAADVHDAGWFGVLSKKAGQLMLMMLAGTACLAKKLGS